MKSSDSIEFTVQLQRLARPAADVLLLLTAIFVFVQLQAISTNHEKKEVVQIANTLSQGIARHNAKEKLTYTEQFHDSETALWQGFFLWQGQSKGLNGSCQIQAPNRVEPARFYMLCISDGENNTDNNSNNIVPEVLQTAPVFVANTAPESTPQKNTQPKEKTAQQPTKTIPVRGWLELPDGIKHFDPVSKKWTP